MDLDLKIMLVFVLLILLIRLLYAFVCSSKAKLKNYSSALWFLGGCCFGLIAALVIDALPYRKREEEYEEDEDDQEDENEGFAEVEELKPVNGANTETKEQ